MRRKNTEILGDVIRQALKENGLDKHLNEMLLMQSWQSVVGKVASGYTDDLSVKNGVLYAKISSAALRNELFLSKTILIKNLNRTAGVDVIHDIRFV